MAITALNSAATGLRALSTRIDVVANNLANAETTAFKRSRVNFEDLMYLVLKQPGATNASQEVSPSGIFVGLGTRISNTQLDLEQGSLESTNRQLDVGIQGQGFLKVKIMDTVGNGVGYTRNGNFFVNNKGELVLGMGDGYKLIPPIVIPPGSTDISISTDGTINVVKPGATAKNKVGQLELTQHDRREPSGSVAGHLREKGGRNANQPAKQLRQNDAARAAPCGTGVGGGGGAGAGPLRARRHRGFRPRHRHARVARRGHDR